MMISGALRKYFSDEKWYSTMLEGVRGGDEFPGCQTFTHQLPSPKYFIILSTLISMIVNFKDMIPMNGKKD